MKDEEDRAKLRGGGEYGEAKVPVAHYFRPLCAESSAGLT
jgi:hypothetical protein